MKSFLDGIRFTRVNVAPNCVEVTGCGVMVISKKVVDCQHLRPELVENILLDAERAIREEFAAELYAKPREVLERFDRALYNKALSPTSAGQFITLAVGYIEELREAMQ